MSNFNSFSKLNRPIAVRRSISFFDKTKIFISINCKITFRIDICQMEAIFVCTAYTIYN